MKKAEKFKLAKLTNLVIFTAALVPVLLYGFILFQRMGYPFDIEWAEGAAVNQVNRILASESLYDAPSLEFSALVYTPLYYFLAAALVPITGSILSALRLLSAISSLGSGILIFGIIHRLTKNFLAGWVSAALYLACFHLSDGFYDLARVDSFYVLSLICGLFILLKARKFPGYLLAGSWIAAAFYIKQSALLVFLPVAVCVLVKNLKKSWPMAAAGGVGLAVPWGILQAQSSGWFSYYIYYLPGQHGYSLFSALDFWVGDILGPLGIAAGLIVFYLVWKPGEQTALQSVEGSSPPGLLLPDAVTRDNGLTPRALLHLFCLGAVLTAWLTRSANGGGANNLMPAYGALALVFGLALNKAYLLMGRDPAGGERGSVLLMTVMVIQFAGLVYNPFNYLPSELDRQINQIVVDKIQSADGPVLIPYRSHLVTEAGGETQIHMINIFEITGYFNGQVQPAGVQLVEQLRRNVCDQRYALIVLDQPVAWLERQVESAYQRLEEPQVKTDGFRSAALGWQQGYLAMYEPRDSYQMDPCLDFDRTD